MVRLSVQASLSIKQLALYLHLQQRSPYLSSEQRWNVNPSFLKYLLSFVGICFEQTFKQHDSMELTVTRDIVRIRFEQTFKQQDSTELTVTRDICHE